MENKETKKFEAPVLTILSEDSRAEATYGPERPYDRGASGWGNCCFR